METKLSKIRIPRDGRNSYFFQTTGFFHGFSMVFSYWPKFSMEFWAPPIGNLAFRCRETAKGRRSHEQDGQHAADEDAAAGPIEEPSGLIAGSGTGDGKPMKLPDMVNCHITNWNITMLLIGKSMISTPFSIAFCMLTVDGHPAPAGMVWKPINKSSIKGINPPIPGINHLIKGINKYRFILHHHLI